MSANAIFSIPANQLSPSGAGSTQIIDLSMQRNALDYNTQIALTEPVGSIEFLPKKVVINNVTGLALTYLLIWDDKKYLAYTKEKKSHQRFYASSTITGATATGLANDGTLYEATFYVKGTAYNFSVAGSSLQTYTALLTQINTVLTGIATASLVDLVNETTHIELLLANFGLLRTVDGISGSVNPKLFDSLGLTINPPIHNQFDFLTLANNSTEIHTGRKVKYVIVIAPASVASAALTLECSEYSS